MDDIEVVGMRWALAWCVGYGVGMTLAGAYILRAGIIGYDSWDRALGIVLMVLGFLLSFGVLVEAHDRS